MKKLPHIAAALLILVLLASCSSIAGNGKDEISILYVGNSFVYTKNAAMKAMDRKQYTYVVIQDYGTRPGSDGFFTDVEALCDKAHETGAKPVLYSPAWTNLDAVPHRQSQKEYTDAYREAAALNGALLVNAGDAWVYAYDTVEGIDLYKENDYHANDAGSYLTACVFVSTLFDIHVKDATKKNRYSGELALPLGWAAWEFVNYRNENGCEYDILAGD